MKEYLTPDHPDAFVDWELRKPERDLTKMCPVCKGHGGWNLELNAYQNQYEDTPANRHLFSHFRAHCSHCNGWGYVEESEMCPGHEWETVKSLGNCLRLEKCRKCGAEIQVDSSD